MGGRVIGAAIAALLASCVFAGGAPGVANAEDAVYVFDALRSLTGSCDVSAEDPTPDPAIPTCPSEAGAHPPHGPFIEPRSVATDSYGNIYIPNNKVEEGEVFGRIEVFNADGIFLAEVTEPGFEAEDLAVDKEDHLYVYGFDGEALVYRFDPGLEHDPKNGKIDYEAPIKVVDGSTSGMSIQNNSIAVDSTGHLYVDLRTHINKYRPASEANALLDSSIGEGELEDSKWVTVDSRNGEIYATDRAGTPESPSVVKVLSKEPGHLLTRSITGFSAGYISVAIDETSGRVFVGDVFSRKKVYVLPESTANQTANESIATIEHSFSVSYQMRVAIDNGAFSLNKGSLFVSSESKTKLPPDHVYTFRPIPPPHEPEINSGVASGITETEAEIQAAINPGNAATNYTLEYVREAQFEASGFEGATMAAEGTLPVGDQDVSVSASLSGLESGTRYHVRVFAENHCSLKDPKEICTDEEEITFRTYPVVPLFGPCLNDPLRAGSSAHLPDCRAYELVTPPDTGGRPPLSIGISDSDLFGTPTATTAGGSVSFIVGAGGIPGLGGAGGFFGDGYVSERGPEGWQTHLAGPTGDQMSNPEAGGLSPDHGFAAWAMNGLGSGSLFIEGGAHYIRYPDGSFHLVGRGSEGDDPRARIKRITDSGGHMIFQGEVQLELEAPESGTAAIYDRTRDPLTGEEETHVVSLLPEEEPQGEGEDATYEGASADGSAIAFKLGNTATSPLYLRVGNAETLIAAEPGAQFAGLSNDGRYLFYVLKGDIYRFDSQEEGTEKLTESEDAIVVNVSPDGSHAYFVSPSILSGEEENSEGDKAIEGEENLYVWNGEGIGFIGTVTDRDVEGEYNGNAQLDGLGLWAFMPDPKEPRPITTGELSRDPSRTNADGSVFLFKSRANLTVYDAEGKAQAYRYDSTSGELSCPSCNPTEVPATADGTLLSVGSTFIDAPVKTFAQVPNLRGDGKRAFFESPEPLVIGDTNGKLDVYEWEEAGIGSCETPGGCVYLISSGHSSRPSYLYGVSASGDDVFITTSDRLVGSDHDETPSIYDARVGGGFAEPGKEICVGESCKAEPTAPPALDTPTSGSPHSEPAPFASHPCPRGTRKIKRHGKTRCVKRRHHKHRRSGGSR